jgi:TadE-like protein
MNSMKKIIAGASGSEIAEAALVLPLMFTILLGIYWFGRAYNVYATLNFAARDAARSAVAPTCAMCTSGNQFSSLNAIAAVVRQDLQASQIDPAQVQPLPTANLDLPPGDSAFISCASGAGIPNCSVPSSGPQVCIFQNVYVDYVSADPDLQSCGVSVSFQYPYQVSLPFTSLNMTRINLKAEAQMAQEN